MKGNELGILPAYPVDELNHQFGTVAANHLGMTMREAFALACVQGFCANSAECITSASSSVLATWAFEIADKMLEESAKGPKS